MSYPASIDTFPSQATLAADTLATVPHSKLHGDLGIAITAIETQLGTTGAFNFALATTTVNGHALSSNVTVTKSDVGLGAVENTALSTWAGSSAITTVGTLAAGSIPYSLITGAPASGLTIDTTTITGGTIGKVLYHESGNVVGEYAISGTGSVAMTGSPTFTTQITTPQVVAPTPGGGAANNLTLQASPAVSGAGGNVTLIPTAHVTSGADGYVEILQPGQATGSTSAGRIWHDGTSLIIENPKVIAGGSITRIRDVTTGKDLCFTAAQQVGSFYVAGIGSDSVNTTIGFYIGNDCQWASTQDGVIASSGGALGFASTTTPYKGGPSGDLETYFQRLSPQNLVLYGNYAGTLYGSITLAGITCKSSSTTYATIGSNGLIVNGVSASTICGTFQGAASQTADLLQLKNSSGTVLTKFDSSGALTTASPTFTGQVTAKTGAAGTIGAVVKGAASQTADLQQWQDSTGTVLASVAATGGLVVNNQVTINAQADFKGLVLTSTGQRCRLSMAGSGGGNPVTFDVTAAGGGQQLSLGGIIGNLAFTTINISPDGGAHNSAVFSNGTVPLLQLDLSQINKPAVAVLTQKAAALRTAAISNYQTSAGGSLGNVSGGCVFDVLADVSTTSTDGTLDTLRADTFVANALIVVGDKIYFDYTLSAVASASATSRFLLSFAGITIFDTGALTIGNLAGVIRIKGYITEKTATTARATIEFDTDTTTILYAPVTYTPDGTLTGLTLTGTNNLVLKAARAGAGAASGDIKLVQATGGITGFGS